MFDRHEILKRHYVDEIRQWNWDWVTSSFDQNSKDSDCYDVDEDSKYVYLFIGSVFALTPSGKVYAFWTSNQTRADETRDAAWWEALEQVCEEHGCFQSCPDNCDGADIFLCKRYDVEEELDDSMDGDHASALASAGLGTDEDYGGHDAYDDFLP
jgi:hypothetical protein